MFLGTDWYLRNFSSEIACAIGFTYTKQCLTMEVYSLIPHTAKVFHLQGMVAITYGMSIVA